MILKSMVWWHFPVSTHPRYNILHFYIHLSVSSSKCLHLLWVEVRGWNLISKSQACLFVEKWHKLFQLLFQTNILLFYKWSFNYMIFLPGFLVLTWDCEIVLLYKHVFHLPLNMCIFKRYTQACCSLKYEVFCNAK